MNHMASITADLPTGITRTDRSGGLAAITEPACAAVIWERLSDPGFQDWIDGLDQARLPMARLILNVGEVRSALADACDTYQTPDSPERAQLVEDIVSLASVFADLMKTQHLRLRLSAVDTNACRRFHIDAVTARLICTYRGTGTQLGLSADDAEPRRILSVPTGVPLVLRGSNWPEHPASGLLHRSPPIDGTGETRLVLVLDPIFDPEEAA